MSMASGATTLADVTCSAAAALGVPGYQDVLSLDAPRHVVLCLVDGLGWNALQSHLRAVPNLADLPGAQIDAAFPTTTPVGLASVGMGELAGRHGFVGASFELPDTGAVLSPLQWGHHPTPLAVQPETTVFERLAQQGVVVSTLSPQAYVNSGLTRAVLRGGEYRGVESIDDRVTGLRAVQASGGPSFTYVYWGELDRVGHEMGVGSSAWGAALTRVDRLIAGLRESLAPDSVLLVTADHGMVDCPEERRIVLEDHRSLTGGVRRWAGEPRVRHVYTEVGAQDAVADRWRGELADRVDIFTREEIIDAGLMGPVDPLLAERIGDVVAVAREDWMMASRVDRTVSGLIGQHGSLSADELLIPLLMART